jgi:flagellar biosynthesis protein
VTAPEKRLLAVALRYDEPDAPRVVAVGRGLLGQRIIDTALAHGVPLETNAPLAQALSSVEVESEIPEQLYEAIAVIIAFVMQAARSPAQPRPSLAPGLTAGPAAPPAGAAREA